LEEWLGKAMANKFPKTSEDATSESANHQHLDELRFHQPSVRSE
jgi:hypothetical protein